MVDARTGAEICEQETAAVNAAIKEANDMGKRKQERARIIGIIEWHAKECEAGSQTLCFDAKEKTTKEELQRQAKRLRWLIQQIEPGHKEAEGTGE